MGMEHMQRLVDVARAEYGELVQATLYRPGSGHLIVILVGREWAIYTGAGARVRPHPSCVSRWRRTR